MTINSPFDSELSDPSSNEYRTLSIAIEQSLDPLFYARFPTFFTGTQVNRFYPDAQNRITVESIIDFNNDRLNTNLIKQIFNDYVQNCNSKCFGSYSLVPSSSSIEENSQCDYTCPFTTDCVFEGPNSTHLIACRCKNGYYPLVTVPGDVELQFCNDIDECQETPGICGSRVCKYYDYLMTTIDIIINLLNIETKLHQLMDHPC